jgi:ADP-dependent NAD(P)H-hydrate dehydratase / NAD(P)H-hydrate epimerase
MRWPVRLLKRDKKAHKNQYGHVLVLAGSRSMLGAACLTGLAAMRAGAGLTTIGVARSLNLTLQKKLAHVIMTLPLAETRGMTISSGAFAQIKKIWNKYSAIAIGPGLSDDPSTKRFILEMVVKCPLPMVIDADALNALAGKLSLLRGVSAPRILTPHPGEFQRLSGTKPLTDADCRRQAKTFAKRYGCILVLKGHRTVVAAPTGKVYVNTTGNPGMATAGSGDVLTGMIAAFLARGLTPFEAARWGVYWHGKAGDKAARNARPLSMIASDMIPKKGKR